LISGNLFAQLGNDFNCPSARGEKITGVDLGFSTACKDATPTNDQFILATIATVTESRYVPVLEGTEAW